MEIFFVGIGGALGSVTRYYLGSILFKKLNSIFPLATFIVNITGAILLGMAIKMHLDNNLYLFIGEGFLGSYTTFSTFMYEGFSLFKDNKLLNAFAYILSSIILGVFGFYLGYNKYIE